MQDKKIKTIDEAFMKDLRVALKDTLFYDDWQEAYGFARKFEPPLANKSSQIPEQFRQELWDWVIKAKWSALPSLKDGEIIDLFQNHFIVQYEIPGEYYDIWDKLRAKLVMISFYEDRDKLRQKIKDVLFSNEEIIVGKGPVDETGKELKATIKNWLLDYHKRLGEEMVDSIKLNEYVIRHSVISKLSDKEREKLKKLFIFFEIVKISSLDPRGYEEAISVDDEKMGLGIVQSGRFIPVAQDRIAEMGNFIKKLEEVGAIGKKLDEKIAQGKITKSESGSKKDINIEKKIKYQDSHVGDSNKETAEIDLQKKFQKFLTGQLAVKSFAVGEKMEQELGGDLKGIRNKFYHAVNEGNQEETAAALLVMAEKGQLKEAFGDDERFIKFWGSYLEKNNLDAEQFKNDPANGKDVAMFIKYILEARLKISQDETAMIGAVLSNLARKAKELEYQEMVYGDLESQKFLWNF